MIGWRPFKARKPCNMIISGEVYRRDHDQTGTVFKTLFPDRVADMVLFPDMPALFQRMFPRPQKTVTMGL